MNKFKKVYIEITNVCNLSCDFCPKTKRPAEFMGEEFFEEILEKLTGFTEYIYLHVMGEPLLHPKIGLLLDICSKHDFKVNLTTNGTLIDTAADTIIKKPALRQVNFSLHSFESNECDDISGVKAHVFLDLYLNKIFNFIKTASASNRLLVSLRLWNLSQRGKNENNSFIINRIENEFGIEGLADSLGLQPKGIKVKENLYLNQAEFFDWPDIELEDINSIGFCHGLRDQAGILVDGTVIPCCLDSEGNINLGNIKEHSFSEIIESKRARKLYDSFSKREAVEPLCKKCGYRNRFGVESRK